MRRATTPAPHANTSVCPGAPLVERHVSVGVPFRARGRLCFSSPPPSESQHVRRAAGVTVDPLANLPRALSANRMTRGARMVHMALGIDAPAAAPDVQLDSDTDGALP